MKNIYILMTDKPTWFHKSILTGILRKSSSCINDMKQAYGVNIHITSDEEIKEGDWVLFISTNEVTKVPLGGFKGKVCKKIILTTDQDLIKDGVQYIDDEFLEWFVKNPSCEWVEIERDSREVGSHNGGIVIEYGLYEIIIPKEEPKTTGDIGVDYALAQSKAIQKSMHLDAEIAYKSLSKQETLEEELLQQIKFCLICKNDSQAIRLIEKYGFEKQEKCEKDLDAHLDVAEHLWLQAVKENKKMYNKEELLNFADFYHKYKELIKAEKWEIIEISKEEVFKKWFEQFKNK